MELVKAEDFNVQPEKAKELTSGLNVTIEERKALISEFNEVSRLEITEENLPKFKELRLKIVKNRTQGINKWHKANKEFFLAGGRFVDAIKNKEISVNEEMESVLMNAEKHFENLEKKRIEDLQNKRVLELEKYDVENSEALGLGLMSEEVWISFLSGTKLKYKEKIELEKKAEEERIAREKAEAEERERIRKENEQLKKEAEERERKAKIEAEKRAKEEKERQAKAEAERKEREEKERKEREAYEAKLKAEREEKERMQRELEAKAEAERKAKEEEKARVEAELNKGDAAKVKDLITDLTGLKTKYTFKSAKNKKMYEDVSALLDKVINHIK
jgi:hypothetical protein